MQPFRIISGPLTRLAPLVYMNINESNSYGNKLGIATTRC